MEKTCLCLTNLNINHNGIDSTIPESKNSTKQTSVFFNERQPRVALRARR